LRKALQKNIGAHEDEEQRYGSFAEDFNELKSTLVTREAEAAKHFQELQQHLQDLVVLEGRIESQYHGKVTGYQQLYHRQQLSWWDKQIADQVHVNDSRVEASLQMPPLKTLNAQAKANVERAHASQSEEAEMLLNRQLEAEEVLQEKKDNLLMVVRSETARIKERSSKPAPGSAAERRTDMKVREELSKVRGDVQSMWKELGWQQEEILLHVQSRVAQMKPSASGNHTMQVQLEQFLSQSRMQHLCTECEAKEHSLHSLQDNLETPHEFLEEAMEALADARTQARNAIAAHRETYGD
jgi:hypothetical protein